MQHKRTITQRIATGVLAVAMLFSTLAPTFGPVVYADDVSSIVTDSGGISAGTPEATSAPESSAIPEPSAAPEASAAPTATPETSTAPEETPAPTAAPEESEKPESSAAPEESATPEVSPSPESSATPEPSPTPTATPETSATPAPLGLIAPESDLLEASVGDELTLTVELNREDVEVAYQWQKMYTGKPEAFDTALADYAEDEPTWYSWPLEDKSESEALAENPDATWQGMELYFAIVAALDKIEADSSNVRIAWKTPNYALDGFVITAEAREDGIVLYADKDEERHIGTLQDGEWTFGDAVEASQPEPSTWQDIDGATASTYDLTVTEEDYDTSYRCVVTILDEDYKESCAKLLEEQGIALTDEEKAEEQVLYSATMKITAPVMDEVDFGIAPLAASAAGNPKLSSDAQWITGLTNGYEYITKDTYDRVTGWLNEGKITQKQADRYWTRMLTKGSSAISYANVLDSNGFPTGGESNVRQYIGFDLTDGDKLEVLSEWYGKTVYFRPVENGQKWTSTGTAIDIPAYTNLTIDDDGHYVESASGTKYKKAITMLNAFVPDTGSVYKNYLGVTAPNGWILHSADDNIHIQLYTVNCESFNRDPARYMIDAEGNYRMDSFAWGVCTDQEPDISGKAYWQLKDYIAQGYGLMVGHDTLYAYAGAYYDAFGTDLDESSIDPADTTTRYYALNSWVPNTGHWYMNELMGANGGNVNSGSVLASDAPSLILSTGGSHGQYGKNIQYGTEELHILQTGWDAATAAANVKYRTPTNFPYSFSVGQTFGAAWTHTNQQAAFGTIWVDYSGTNKGAAEYGYYEDPYTWTIGGKTGTNNFYLSGISNFLMNQVGHLPTNSATTDESKLFTNSVLYISQRKQCEICAANQGGQENSHFVRRISSANADEVLTALQNGGSYWYPLDGCYMLVEDITLPANWTPIKNFTGHWNADVYKVDLNGAASVFDTSGSDWNLGTDKSKGVETVFDKNMNRTTGVARVVGDLNDLFGTSTSYAGYTVKVLGSDNPKYMKSGEQYTCSVNSDNKYVISNLPCVYDGTNGNLKVRVYDPAGKEITDYGPIIVKVSTTFWESTETIPLQLLSFSASPVKDVTTYESFGAKLLEGRVYWTSAVTDVQWQVQRSGGGKWENIQDVAELNGKYTASTPSFVDQGDESYTAVELELRDCKTTWNGWHFRAVFKWQGKTADTYSVATNGYSGQLTVKPWPMKLTQAYNRTVWEGENATFTATADYWKGTADGLTVSWEFSKGSGAWYSVAESGEFLDNGSPTVQSSSTTLPVYNSIASRYGLSGVTAQRTTTTLTIKSCDVTMSGYQFRAHWQYTSPSGTRYDWYSTAANNKEYKWDTDVSAFGEATTGGNVADREGVLIVNPANLVVELRKAADEAGSRDHQDDLTPDVYGQKLMITQGSDVAYATATYTAIIYYRPTAMNVTPRWEYSTMLDTQYRTWDQGVASSIDGRVRTSVTNTNLGVLSTSSPYYNSKYAGWAAVKSVLTITNPVASMYDTSTVTKYFFRCYGTGTYSTSSGTKERTGKSVNGGLVLDYEIVLHHNGVNTYDKKNIINGQTVTDYKGMSSATSGREASTWSYPELQLIEPKHVNTVLVQFSSENFDRRDSISYDGGKASAYGINVSGNQYAWTFKANNVNTVSTDQWQDFLRSVTFTVYDPMSISAAGVQGGTEVFWYADEDLWNANMIYNGTNGHFYSYVSKYNNGTGAFVTWYQARSKATSMYCAPLDTYGYLAHITSAEEQKMLEDLLDGAYGYIGAYRYNDQSSEWYWIDGPESETSTPFFKDGKLQWGYEKWAPGEPSGTNQAVHYNPVLGGWGNVERAHECDGFVVEWGDETHNSLRPTNHSVSDSDRIGTQVSYQGKVEINATVLDGSKLYDKAELMPVITVNSDTISNPAQYVQATITCATPSAAYPQRTIAASASSGSGVINAGTYTVKLSLTQAGINAGYYLTGDLEGTLIVKKRPVNLYSHDNNKVYDKTSDATINNIQFEGLTATSGVVSGDTVTLSTTNATGYYTNGSVGVVDRGSYSIRRTSPLSLSSNPYSNYYIGNEDYTGSITARPLTVHSRYLDDPNNARNIKAYDATTAATIGDILIDNIVDGDAVWVDKKTYAGTYATANAGETLDENGHTLPNRFLRLEENAITRTEPIRLVNDPNGNYYIAQEIYSGAIYRASLTAQVSSSRTMYGQPVDYGEAGKPWHDTVPYKANTAATEGCWLKLDGLKGADTLTADYGKSNFSILDVPGLVVDETTPVGMYKLTYTGLTEANYPVLSNYIVAVLDGTQEVYAREIRLTVEDSDRYVEDDSLPETHVTFDLLEDDGETYAVLGSNADVLYKDMPLKNGDTVQSVVLVKEQGSENTISLADGTGSKLVAEIEENGTKKTQYTNDSIPLVSDWFMGCPAKYLDLEHDQSIYPCDWCEQYHGFELGTDHWLVTGYAATVNQNADQNATLTVATVENPLGEQVQNYSLRYVAGSITVHPELRFQLKATVPLYVCMYGYAGDGEVVEPTNYGITNYSNGKIQITDIDVSNNGWNIVDKPQSELKRGELSMKLDDTQLVMGHNTPRTPWIIDPGRDADGNESGTVLPLPLLCNMAGGNANDRQEAFLTRVTYTIAEYGITIPGDTDVEIGDVIDGQPTTPVIGQK